MGDIRVSANDTWRDWEVDGVASTGPHEPEKADIRATMGVVEDIATSVAAGNGAGYFTFLSLALMNADTAAGLNATAQNLEDGNEYRKTGLPSTWTLIGTSSPARLTAIEAANVILENKAKTALRTAGNLDFFAGLFTDLVLTAEADTIIKNADGTEDNSTGKLATGFVEVTATSAITRFGTTVDSGPTAPYAYYDEDYVFLGYDYSAMVEGAQVILIGTDAPDGTKYVRMTAANSAAQLYVYDTKLVQFFKDMLFSIFGTPSDSAGALTGQYVNKGTGVLASAGSLKLTPPLDVTADSWICSGSGLISPNDALQAVYTFFDADDAYLGYYNPIARWQAVKVGDIFADAATVRVTMPLADQGPVHVIRTSEGLALALDMLNNGAIVDYFADALIVPGRLNSSGGVTQPTHPTRRVTADFIPVTEGQVFYVTCQDITSAGPVIAGYDEDKIYTGALLAGATNDDFLDYRLVIPEGIAFIKGTFGSDTPPFSLLSVRPAQAIQEQAAPGTVAYLAPDAAYGRVDEPVYLFARGVVGDAAVTVEWSPDPSEFSDFKNDTKVRVLKADADLAHVSVRAIVGAGRLDISTFPVRLTDTDAAISPAAHINVVCIGDSTTSQLPLADPDAIDGNGTWVNEMSRQLTGTGDAALVIGSDGSIDNGSEWGPVVSGDIRAALALTNIHFRGTRGSGTIKHEGRGGWHPSNYLERTDVVGGDGKSNAFWDPDLTPWGPEGTTWQFSMKYFIENNGWDVGSIVSGVEADGSNLLVIIALGWNDFGNNTDPGVSAGHMAALADQINLEYPNAKVWMPSLWAPPGAVFKANTGSVARWYSQAGIFDEAVRAFGVAYRGIAADRSAYCEFVQVSHQMDPDFCFSKSTMAPNRVANDTSLVISGAGDNVHMRRRGYRMFADVLTDKFLYDYCRDGS